MWTRPWRYKEGVIIGTGLILTGVFLQMAIGRVEWDALAWPVSGIALVIFLLLLIAAHLLRHRLYLVSYLGSAQSAVCSIAWASALTVVMGLVRQVPSTMPAGAFPWLQQMLSNWAFVLVYIWMVVSLGLAVLRVCIPLKLSRIPFLLNHLGLFIAIVCAVIGSADLQRLKMTATLGNPEWRATNDNGEIIELPIAVELKSFNIDEYPPKLMLADNKSGRAMPLDVPQNLLLEDGCTGGSLCDWNIEVLEILADAAPVIGSDTISYNEFHSSGAAAAALIKATNSNGHEVQGWVASGSYAFPAKALALDDKVSVVMPEREPQRYVSAVNIYTQSGGSYTDTIKVNSPCRIEGWKIYQYSYDSEMGKWSQYSVFEIIRDPWIGAVYTGILMLIAGAICMFVQFGSINNKDEE